MPVMSNINDIYFDGHYKDIWRAMIPSELTTKEVDFMISYFGLNSGSKVLDLMCGYGRHAIGLAQKGIHVTAVDNLGEYTDEIKKTARDEDLPLTVVKADVSNFEPEEIYDLAICMGNSINFFPGSDVIRIMKSVSAHLRPGGHFLINTWSLAEIVLRDFKEKGWSWVGDLRFLTESKYLFQPSRVETEHLIISQDGSSEVKKGVDYIYTVSEMESHLSKAGLTLKEIYSIPGRKKFAVGEPRAYIIAAKT